MAFSDPQTVTINGNANTLPRVASGINTGGFTTNDGTVGLTVASSLGKRIRRTARLNHSKIAPDPLISSQNIKYSSSFYVVADVPITGYTVSEQTQILLALIGWLQASSGANITKLLGGEN
jgi:hypothetical protein